jgi:hypothetical protein
MYGRNMNWENPLTLSEKIIWLEYNSDTTIWSELSDKYRVREYVKKCGLEHILVKLYGVWKRPDDIDFEILPNSFVLKTNNGSGDVVIVKDKSKENLNSIKKKIKKAFKTRHGIISCEPHYLCINPCIIAEELLPTDTSISSSIVDYKIWCFNGKPYVCLTCANRNIQKHTRDLGLYDITTWKPYPEYFNEKNKSDFIIPKPKNIEKLIKYATILSTGFSQVRVDLYDIKDRIYFGEMTFTSDCGLIYYHTPEYLNKLGSQFNIL